jgi:EmrB/QacA subfamily drug resistance transporter
VAEQLTPHAPPAVLRRIPRSEQGSRKRRLTFAVIAVGVFMAQLDLFIVNIAFPAIGHDFPGSSGESLSWVLNAYAIVFAACLVPAGRLGDLLGRRRTFELGLLVFAIGSAGCAASPSVLGLVVARVVQAIGAALLVPTSLGLLLHAFPASARVGAIGAWASVGAIAAASGPPLGGVLVQASWRLIFLVNLPLAIGALLASRRYLEEVRHPEEGGLPDLAGIVLLVGGIGGLVLCIVKGSAWGWGSTAFIAGTLTAVGVLGAFVARCATHRNPVVELPLLALRPFAVANGVMALFFAAFGTMLLISVLFLTGPWHRGTIDAGLMISPGPLTVALLSFNVKRIVPLFGVRRIVLTGCLLTATGGAWWAWQMNGTPDYAGHYLPGLLIAAIGIGLTQPALFGLAASVLPGNRFATGSGVLNMSRQIGLALGVAILVALLGSAPAPHAFRHGFDEMASFAVLAGAIATLLPQRSRRPTAA